MHRRIHRVGPGSCPICGMALEPELVTAQAAPNAELVDLGRRFWVGLALTLPVFLLEMGGHLTGLHQWLGQQNGNWLQLAIVAVDDFDSPVGKGVTGTADGRRLTVGNRAIMADANNDTTALDADTDAFRKDGATAIFVAIDGKAAGVIAIADPIRATSQAAVTALKAAGIRVVMLTGDNATTAKAVAARLGITDVEADVLPADKSKVVEKLRAAGRVVAMAGDGVNDAPALAAADVGIAMETGTDVAMQSAGITPLSGHLNGIVCARAQSAATMSNIRQNLFFAFVYSPTGVPIAAGILYPWFGITLSPMIAAGAMTLSSVSVIGNALRLRTTTL